MPNPKHEPWTDDEIEALRLAYSHWPIRWDLLLEETRRRSRSSIFNRAVSLGLTGKRPIPDYSHVTEAQWGYLAGMLDADGTIQIGMGGCKVGVILINTHRPLIDWALATFPGGGSHTVTVEKQNSYKSRSGYALAKKDMHRATWQRETVVTPLLRGIIPHMIVKRDRAEGALAFLEEHGSHVGSN